MPVRAQSPRSSSKPAPKSPSRTLDLTDLLDLQQTRPIAHFAEGGLRVIDWPQLAVRRGPHRARHRRRARPRAFVAVADGRGRDRRGRDPARRARRGHARRDAGARLASPAALGARDGDEPLARPGGRARCAPTTPGRPARRRSCSTRSARPGIPCVGPVGPGAAVRRGLAVAARGASPARRVSPSCTGSTSTSARSTPAPTRTPVGSRRVWRPGPTSRRSSTASTARLRPRPGRRARRRDRTLPALPVRRVGACVDAGRDDVTDRAAALLHRCLVLAVLAAGMH